MTYVRFAASLPRYLSRRITLDEARSIVRDRLARRDEHFLRLVEQSVFVYSRSPYLPLMRQAGCTMADLRRLVATRGLESTLSSLHRHAVLIFAPGRFARPRAVSYRVGDRRECR